MARVIYSALISDMRGTLGGSYFSRSKQGAVIVSKVSRVNNKSYRASVGLAKYVNSQTSIRQYMKIITAKWGTLSIAEQAAWAQFALSGLITAKKTTGAPVSGYNCYVKINMRLWLWHNNYISVPPIYLTVAGIGSVNSPVITPSSFRVNTQYHISSSFRLEIAATRSMSGGRQPKQSDFKILGYYLKTSTALVNVYPSYVLNFGAPVVNAIIHVRCQVVNIVTGQASDYYYNQAVVTV